MEPQLLHTLDYVVFAAMLAISAAIGVYFRFAGGKQKTSEEYLMGGKNMSIIPVAFSLMATFISSITVMGLPSEIYRFGIAIAYTNIGHVVGMILSSYMCLPVFFDLQISSIFEYLDKRFGKIAKTVASVAFILNTIPAASVVLYAPALVLSTVAYLSTWTSVISVGAICTFYCTIGGMKAVIWTDLFQALLMFLGILVILISGFINLDFKDVISVAYERHRLDVPSIQLDPTIRYTIWGLLCQGFILAMSCYSASQVQVQRLLTLKNVTNSRRSLFLSIVMIMSFSLLTCLVGLVIFAEFADCDPFTSPDHPITQVDQLLPYYMMQTIGRYPGLLGLCICGVFSSSLSTVSSAINSLTAVTMQELTQILVAKGASQIHITFVSKVITMLYGCVCIASTFLAAYTGNLVQAALTFTGLVGGPVLGVFMLGMLTTRVHEKGVGVGIVLSIIISCWITFGASANARPPEMLPVSIEGCPLDNLTLYDLTNLTTPFFNDSSVNLTYHQDHNANTDDIFYLYRISYMWFSSIGFALTVVIGYISSIIISLATGKAQRVPMELLSPFVRNFFNDTDIEENFAESKVNDMKESTIKGNKISFLQDGLQYPDHKGQNDIKKPL